MNTDLLNKTIEELRQYCLDGGMLYGISAFDELANRLSEAQQQIADRDAALSQCSLIMTRTIEELEENCEFEGKLTSFLLLTKDMREILYSLPASAKYDAAIIKAAEEVPDINDSKDGVFLPTQKFWNAISALCKAVRAKGEKI